MIVIEDGSGVAGAEAWASVAYVDAYWANRPQRAYAATWASLSTPVKEGAIREATALINSMDEQFRGIRRGWLQGLCWPRTEALDVSGYELPDVPDLLLQATSELAVRASAGELRADLDQIGGLTSASAGSVSVTFATGQGGTGAVQLKVYTAAMDLLKPLLTTGGAGGWAWA